MVHKKGQVKGQTMWKNNLSILEITCNACEIFILDEILQILHSKE